jgi:hypothetical protein
VLSRAGWASPVSTWPTVDKKRGGVQVSAKVPKEAQSPLTLPSQVERVLHTRIHALSSLWRVSVTSVSSCHGSETVSEDTWSERLFPVMHQHTKEDPVILAERLCQPLADMVAGEPLDVPGIKGIRLEHCAGGVKDGFCGDLATVEILSLLDTGGQLDVETNETSAGIRKKMDVS